MSGAPHLTYVLLVVAGATALAQGPRAIDEEAVRAAGIRRHDGARLTLYTDLGDDAVCESLLTAFEQAYPQWCRYFHVDEETEPAWRATGCVMLDRERFRQAGLLPAELPDFRHGYTLHDRFWLDDQQSDYYRRHLLLHEGTHSFMFTRLGSCGPNWYMEGVAELLATHRADDAGLQLNYFPARREEVPLLGRIKLVCDDVAAGRLLLPAELLELGPRDNQGYAWAWAWAAFLEGHPRYRDAFRSLAAHVRDEDFNAVARRAFAGLGPEIMVEWPLFVTELEHGYDLARTAVEFAAGEPLPPDGAAITVRTDRGWQSSGVQVAAGKSYRLTASGRYQLVAGPPAWPCEAGGVSIRYHRGSPLGVLQAAVLADPPRLGTPPAGPRDGLMHPKSVGLAATIVPDTDGTLYFRVNDSPAELADNEGTLRVEITAE